MAEHHTYKIRYGEESPNYQTLYAKYSHVGCPDAAYEDNCAHPADCALAGGCLDRRDRIAAAARADDSGENISCPRGGICPYGGFCPDCVEATRDRRDHDRREGRSLLSIWHDVKAEE